MSFDVQIETSPDIQLESSLTENLQAEANDGDPGRISWGTVLRMVATNRLGAEPLTEFRYDGQKNETSNISWYQGSP